MTHSIIQSDALAFFRAQPADSIDLVFGSPPYEEARLYLEAGQNLGVARKTEEWVAWMVEVYREAQRVCRGLVAFVVAGQTRNYRWSAGPALLAADLCRAGFNLRNPAIFHRIGIPGSGGPDWLRGDYEWIICTTRPGKLPWSDNTACGEPPKYEPGGAMSYRNAEGIRENNGNGPKFHERLGKTSRTAKPPNGKAPNGKAPNGKAPNGKAPNGKAPNGDLAEYRDYIPPEKANPGNVIKCLVGGGVMGGDAFCSQNEAPFPEALAEFFICSFCPLGGTVADCFSGSGTTAAVAVRNGRNFIGCDLRESQVRLGLRRVEQETPLELFA